MASGHNRSVRESRDRLLALRLSNDYGTLHVPTAAVIHEVSSQDLFVEMQPREH